MANKLRDGNSPENVGSRRRLPAVSAGGRGGGRGGCCGSYWFLLTSGTLLTLVLLAAIAIYLWCEVEWERNAAAVLAAPSGPATDPDPTYFPLSSTVTVLTIPWLSSFSSTTLHSLNVGAENLDELLIKQTSPTLTDRSSCLHALLGTSSGNT